MPELTELQRHLHTIYLNYNSSIIRRDLYALFTNMSDIQKRSLLTSLHTSQLDQAHRESIFFTHKDQIDQHQNYALSINHYFHLLLTLLKAKLIATDFIFELFSFKEKKSNITLLHYFFHTEISKNSVNRKNKLVLLFLAFLKYLAQYDSCSTNIIKLLTHQFILERTDHGKAIISISTPLLSVAIDQDLKTRIKYLSFLFDLLKKDSLKEPALTNSLIELFRVKNEEGVNFGITCIDADYTCENNFKKITNLCISYLDLLKQLTNSNTADKILEILTHVPDPNDSTHNINPFFATLLDEISCDDYSQEDKQLWENVALHYASLLEKIIDHQSNHNFIAVHILHICQTLSLNISAGRQLERDVFLTLKEIILGLAQKITLATEFYTATYNSLIKIELNGIENRINYNFGKTRSSSLQTTLPLTVETNPLKSPPFTTQSSPQFFSPDTNQRQIMEEILKQILFVNNRTPEKKPKSDKAPQNNRAPSRRKRKRKEEADKKDSDKTELLPASPSKRLHK